MSDDNSTKILPRFAGLSQGILSPIGRSVENATGELCPRQYTYAYGPLHDVEAEELRDILRKDGLLDAESRWTDRGRRSRIVLLGGGLFHSHWMDYVAFIQTLDPDFGTINSVFVLVVDDADEDSLRWLLGSSAKWQKKEILAQIHGLSFRIVRIGNRLLTASAANVVAKDGVDTALQQNMDHQQTIQSILRDLAARKEFTQVAKQPAIPIRHDIDSKSVIAALQQSGSLLHFVTVERLREPSNSRIRLFSLASDETKTLVRYRSSLATGGEKKTFDLHSSDSKSSKGVKLRYFHGTGRMLGMTRASFFTLAAGMFISVAAAGFIAREVNRVRIPEYGSMSAPEACEQVGGIWLDYGCFCTEKEAFIDPFKEICE